MKGDKTIPLCWAAVAALVLWLIVVASTSAIIEFSLAHFHPR